MKPYCLLLDTKDRRYYMSLKNDEELYGWLDDIYSRTSSGASHPTNFVHQVHVGFDPVTGAFTVRLILVVWLIRLSERIWNARTLEPTSEQLCSPQAPLCK